MKDKLMHFKANFDSFCSKTFDGFNKWFRKHLLLIVFIVLTILALVARTSFINYVSGDMYCPLIPWFNYFREFGFKALGTYPNWNIVLENGTKVPCDYPVSYMNILAFLSLFSSNAIMTIKWSCFIADIALAIGVGLITYHFSKNKYTSLIAYVITLFAPSVFANSAIWGQCDQLYVAIIVFAFLLILKKHNCWASFLIGIAISLKLQSVFFLPFIVYLWLNKKYRLWNIFIIFVGAFITFIPSYIAGAPFMMPLEAYANQMGLYMNANYGSGSMYAFLEMASLKDFFNNGFNIIFAFCVIAFTLFVLYFNKIECNEKNMTYIATLFAIVCPFVLPHMHERYFFMADIFVLIYVLVFKRKYYLAPLMIFSSFNNYTHFLTGEYIFKFLGQDCVRLSALINLFIIISLIKGFKIVKQNHDENTLIEQVS